MFHDYKPLPLDLPTDEEREEEAKKKRDGIRDGSLSGLPGVDGKGEWKRIERVIHSPFWRAMHNLIAHPMLAIYRPLGERLHDYTATRMYAGTGPGIVTNND
jgi:hypothetical protein